MQPKILGLVAGLLLSTTCALPASATTILYHAVMSGPAEATPNASPGTGVALVTIDDVANTMRIEASFTGLLGVVSASHIHCCTVVPGVGTAGVATVTPSFTGFPTGVSAGTYDHTFDLLPFTGTDSYNAAFITANGSVSAARSALLAGIAGGRAYFNIHTNLYQAGEIRGFLQAVPEPGTLALLGLGLVGLGLSRRRRA